MDEKTAHAVRAKVYIAFAVIALLMALFLSGTARRLILAGTAVYCIVMSVVNFRKAKDGEGDDRKQQ